MKTKIIYTPPDEGLLELLQRQLPSLPPREGDYRRNKVAQELAINQLRMLADRAWRAGETKFALGLYEDAQIGAEELYRMAAACERAHAIHKEWVLGWPGNFDLSECSCDIGEAIRYRLTRKEYSVSDHLKVARSWVYTYKNREWKGVEASICLSCVATRDFTLGYARKIAHNMGYDDKVTVANLFVRSLGNWDEHTYLDAALACIRVCGRVEGYKGYPVRNSVISVEYAEV